MELGTVEEVKALAVSTGRSYVRMVMEQGGEILGSCLLELYTDIAPATCQHFLTGVGGKFKGGYQYESSPIHRIVKNAYIQGGDVVDGTGKGNPGWALPDETFAVKHTAPGLIGMATCGEPHTAATQFYITLQPLSWLDGKRVIFGGVVDAAGFELLRLVEGGLSTNNERPIPELTIKSIELVC